MSRILSELLGANEVLLAADLKRLEQASAQPGNDVRLTADILGKRSQKIRELGLDPQDSTGREIYHALLNLLKIHDEFLLKKITGSDQQKNPDLMKQIRQAVLKMDTPKNAWVIKTSVAKKLLKDCPPKKVMKYLGYKSLDSMLKRESVSELYAGMQLLETRQWFEGFIARYKNLRQMDFETRSIDIIQLDKKKWGEATEKFVSEHRHLILQIRELGVIVMLPVELPKRAGLTITLMSQLLHHINEIRLYSAFYKLHQMQPTLGETIANSLLYDKDSHVYLAHHKVHWRVVQRHIGNKGHRHHPEVLEPHVLPEDLSWRKAEESLFRLEPALHFWHDIDHVGHLVDSRPVSFNLMDVAINFWNDIPYEQRLFGHMRDSLWNELFLRYMSEPALEAQALKQLDYESSTPGLLAIAIRRK